MWHPRVAIRLVVVRKLRRGREIAAGRVVAVVIFIGSDVAGLELIRLDVAQNPRPELHAVAEGQRIRVRRAFLGTGQNVQAAEDHFRSPGTVPVGQLESAPREGQMHGDADHLRHREKRRPAVEQILVPVVHAPMFGVVAAKLVSASVGVSTCLPKLALASLG